MSIYYFSSLCVCVIITTHKIAKFAYIASPGTIQTNRILFQKMAVCGFCWSKYSFQITEVRLSLSLSLSLTVKISEFLLLRYQETILSSYQRKMCLRGWEQNSSLRERRSKDVVDCSCRRANNSTKISTHESTSPTPSPNTHTTTQNKTWPLREEITDVTDATEDASEHLRYATDAVDVFPRIRPSRDSRFVTWLMPVRWEILRMHVRTRRTRSPRCTWTCPSAYPVPCTDV